MLKIGNYLIILAVALVAVIKPEAKGSTQPDLTPQIARRAYELYEQEGRHDGHSVQDWVKAEREIQEHADPK